MTYVGNSFVLIAQKTFFAVITLEKVHDIILNEAEFIQKHEWNR